MPAGGTANTNSRPQGLGSAPDGRARGGGGGADGRVRSGAKDSIHYIGAVRNARGPRGARSALPLGYGVIGSPADSGSVSLGSSPGTPAKRSTLEPCLPVEPGFRRSR